MRLKETVSLLEARSEGKRVQRVEIKVGAEAGEGRTHNQGDTDGFLNHFLLLPSS